jgi:1-pyrroline-5-carboxylate dehydrogenase
VSPFNFTAIGGNLCSAPALMGNVVIWKPAPAAVYSNYLVFKILQEAGLPDGVIQFVPGPAPEIVAQCLKHQMFSGLHFTGSTFVFKKLWKDIAANIENYRSFPRIVGETGGKNMHFVHKSANVENVVINTVRSSFEYQGQKCSACSRLYVPDNLWPAVKEGLLSEVQKLKVGPVDKPDSFITNVINKVAFDKIKSFIDHASSSKDAQIIAGGKCDDSVGYFITPTIIVTTDPHFKTMKEEIFGPVLTVFVYPGEEYDKYLKLAESTSDYALTGAVFAQDREAVIKASYVLRNAAGNFYINDKCTGAVVGQQPFGGSRASGTNDKAGACLNLYRWVSARSIKETFVHGTSVSYPSNLE